MPPCRSIPPPRVALTLPEGLAPTLLAQVHTEEEFDWNADFDREATGTEATEHLERIQGVFESRGLPATYAVDWPVVRRRTAAAQLNDWVARGVAEVGAHLHPWVNPPHVEAVDRRNSFAGNLPIEVERAKLTHLVDAIEASVGSRPRTYVAGRYGIGPNTSQLLAELGFWVDGSATPPFDFRAEGGPNFTQFPTAPYRVEGHPTLIGLPVTGAYVGLLRQHGPRLFPVVRRPLMQRAKGEGLASKLKLLSRVRLSPEGFRLADLTSLTRMLMERGERVFTLSLHSTSAMVGGNPYAGNAREVEIVLERMGRYLDWFREELGGQFASHQGLARQLLEIEEPVAPPPATPDRQQAGLGGAR